jgi:hypothetical protein
MPFFFEQIELEHLSTLGVEHDLAPMADTDDNEPRTTLFKPLVEFRSHLDGVFALATIVGLALATGRLQIIV